MLRKTRHLNEYTDEEIRKCWFQTDEYQVIRQNAKLAARLSERRRLLITTPTTDNGDTEDETLYVRGLEAFTRQGRFERQRNKRTGLVAVLEEQQRLREEQSATGKQDSQYIGESLASVYIKAALGPRDKALQVAALDARAAQSP